MTYAQTKRVVTELVVTTARHNYHKQHPIDTTRVISRVLELLKPKWYRRLDEHFVVDAVKIAFKEAVNE